jgi:DNA-binding NtrC family response regulator
MAIATILLVDDEAPILAALVRCLRKDGHRLLTTQRPEEVLAILEREPVDVLISDVLMPRIDGVELVTRVRRRYPSVIPILLTGHGTLDATVRAINEGEVYRFLRKPWDPDGLRTIVRKALEWRDAMEHARAYSNAKLASEQDRDELARAYPGLLEVDLTDGCYVVAPPVKEI